MNAWHPIDRLVVSWFEAERPSAAPAHLLAAVRDGVAATRRRPAWLVADRWTWRHGATIRTTVRGGLAIAVLAALLAVLLMVAGLLGSARPAPPFGLTNPGRIAVDTADGIVLTNGDGSHRVLLVPAEGQSISPTWSRDGLRMAFWHRAGATGSWNLEVVEADGGNPAVLTSGITLRIRETELHQPSNISWSPDSRQLAFAADDTGRTSIFVATLGRVGAERITDPKLFGIDPTWSPDGDLIAFRSGIKGTLHVVAPDGSGEHQLSNLVGTVYWPDWSPDGSRIAVAAKAGDNATDIFVITRDGTTVVDVSSDPGIEVSPAWSPDGKRLAWPRATADDVAQVRIIVAGADGTDPMRIDAPADFAAPVWSPDGLRLYTYGHDLEGGFSSILVVDPAGVAPVVRLPAEGNIGNGNWQRLP